MPNIVNFLLKLFVEMRNMRIIGSVWISGCVQYSTTSQMLYSRVRSFPGLEYNSNTQKSSRTSHKKY